MRRLSEKFRPWPMRSAQVIYRHEAALGPAIFGPLAPVPTQPEHASRRHGPGRVPQPPSSAPGSARRNGTHRLRPLERRRASSSRHDLMARTPNTFAAHRLIWLAEREGVQDRTGRGTLSAPTSSKVRISATLPSSPSWRPEPALLRERAEALLAGDEGADEVRAAEITAQRQGIAGVPTFVINGRLAFSGAQRSEVMLAHLLRDAPPA